MLRPHHILSKIIIKILLIGVYTVFHLMVLREVRTRLFQYQVNEPFVQNITENEKLSFSKLDTRLFYIDYTTSEKHITWRYKVPFGSFFFLGIIGLILVGASAIYYYTLIGGHGVVLFLSFILLQLNPVYHIWALVVLDLGTHYLIPLLSIGLIPITYLKSPIRNRVDLLKKEKPT